MKIVKSPYLTEKLSHFDDIWYTTADIEPDDSRMTKIKIFKAQHGGRPPCWKSFFGHNSSTHCPISAESLQYKSERRANKGRMTKTANFE